MNWVVMTWSAAAGVTLCMAAVHLLVWLKDRRARASLAFVVTAVAAGGIRRGSWR